MWYTLHFYQVNIYTEYDLLFWYQVKGIFLTCCSWNLFLPFGICLWHLAVKFYDILFYDQIEEIFWHTVRGICRIFWYFISQKIKGPIIFSFSIDSETSATHNILTIEMIEKETPKAGKSLLVWFDDHQIIYDKV